MHRGRRSGRVYETPVAVFPTASGVRIALTYGADTDWVKNVVAAGGCRLRTRGRTLTLTAPNVVHDPSRSNTRAFERRVLRALQVEEFLDLSEKPDRMGGPLSAQRAKYAKGSVMSKDGTIIGFRHLGRGPGVVILHGGALASQHYMKLGAALADEFTVYIPDRRGRGLSGPYGPRYSIAREDEDLDAIVTATGAQCVFGAADGGLFALHASITVPAIRKVAVFEPVIFVDQPGLDDFKSVISRQEGLQARGDVAALMAAMAKDAMAGDARGQSVSAPYRLLGWVMTRPLFCRMMLWADARLVKGDDVALRDLIPALKPELDQVKATEGTIDDYKNVTAEVLLMCGTQAPPLFTGTLDALANVLPRAARVELPGLNHGGAQDQGGQPAVIAEQLRRFFHTATRRR
jgi:deazaflavin-dependent oxidoreductase (nitroreductase family)